MKAIKVYAKYVPEIANKFGLQYISKEHCYYGLAEDIDDAAKEEQSIKKALEEGQVEYV